MKFNISVTHIISDKFLRDTLPIMTLHVLMCVYTMYVCVRIYLLFEITAFIPIWTL